MSTDRQSACAFENRNQHPKRKSNFRTTRSFETLLLALTACIVLAATSVASATEPVVKIQEDWKVELNIPEPDDQAPQIVTTFSPSGSLSGVYGVLEVNHATMPEYDAGGMQLQAWNGEDFLWYKNSRRLQLLQREDEQITYTVNMSIESGYLKFEVTNGNSMTWGDFGNSGYFVVWVPTDLNDLSQYNSDFSINKSRVGFASHRVKKFARTAVRKYAQDGTLLDTDSTERVVHQHTADAE